MPDPGVCGVCGGPAAICQDPDAQNAWVVTGTRCYKTRAVNEYLEKRKADKHASALHLTARIDDTRRKTARPGYRRTTHRTTR